MANSQNKSIPDRYIRDGSIGQLLTGEFNENISAATEVWFEYIDSDTAEDTEGIKLIGTISVTDEFKIEYKTLGTEFPPGEYKLVCAVKFDDTKILYSANRQLLKVLTRFECLG